ncbi:MAG: PIF1 family ATP-dependent DNA helicase [bacterium]
MNQALALEIMLDGHSVLLTGAAGAGKTFVLLDFIRRAKAEGKKVAVTATTGLAATHLNGTTIHSWSGIGIHHILPPRFADHLPKSRRETIENTDVLIIDEISMLHDYRLDLVDEICRSVRQNPEPFGGIQLIVCGDFFQLPPINRSGEREGGFVVESFAWEELKPVVCYLDEQHRQDDDEFLSILNAMRSGDVRRNHAESLMERQNADLGYGEEVTELHTTNVDVDQINARKLKELDTESKVYHVTTTGKANYLDTLRRSCLAVDDLELKVGALVMCIRNSQDKKYVNGSLGTVMGFEPATEYPVVKLHTGKTIVVGPETWELRDGDKKRASLAQIPLRLAWAITVHKSQGMTLDAARINLQRAFVEGMGYVALSRVRSLNTLSLTGINQMALRVSPMALEIDAGLRAASAEAEIQFKDLEARAEQRSHEKLAKAPTEPMSQWQARIAKLREEYPKAFKPWSKADEAILIKEYEASKPIDELCNTLERQPGGVIARIKKIYGEDAAVPYELVT